MKRLISILLLMFIYSFVGYCQNPDVQSFESIEELPPPPPPYNYTETDLLDLLSQMQSMLPLKSSDDISFTKIYYDKEAGNVVLLYEIVASTSALELYYRNTFAPTEKLRKSMAILINSSINHLIPYLEFNRVGINLVYQFANGGDVVSSFLYTYDELLEMEKHTEKYLNNVQAMVDASNVSFPMQVDEYSIVLRLEYNQPNNEVIVYYKILDNFFRDFSEVISKEFLREVASYAIKETANKYRKSWGRNNVCDVSNLHFEAVFIDATNAELVRVKE